MDLNHHPEQDLLFYIADDIVDSDMHLMSEFVHELARDRDWLIGPPVFVDTREDAESVSDEPIRTLGGVLKLHSPHGTKLPPTVDSVEYDQAVWLIEKLRDFSKDTGHRIEFELDGTYVGSIASGDLDRLLRVGLLEEWRRELDKRLHGEGEVR